ncbi:Protein of unknown function, partial [Gryllus bimaculatus]
MADVTVMEILEVVAAVTEGGRGCGVGNIVRLELQGRDESLIAVLHQQQQLQSGHLVGRCAARDRCPGHRMAFDGRCYRKRTVREVLCGCAAAPTPHVLGGAECRCAPAGYLHVKQPAAARACRVPDLRFPDARRFAAPAPAAATRRGPCARRQRACFARGAVWLEHPPGCFPLLETGPCPPGHVVALAGSGWETGCVDTRRGCPPGYKRLLYDQLCHSDRELEIAVPGKVLLGLYGEYEIWDSDVEVRFIPRITNGRCDILVNASASSLSGHQRRAPSSATAEGPTAGEARGLEAGQKVAGAPSGLFSFAGERPVTHKSPGGRRPLVTGRWILATSDAVEILDENAFTRISTALQSGVGDQTELESYSAEEPRVQRPNLHTAGESWPTSLASVYGNPAAGSCTQRTTGGSNK